MEKPTHLKSGSLLQGGKYRIEKFLGQGGFGITYLAIQTGLNRKVAIKEFFMKEHCNRDATTSQVSIGSDGSRGLVERFRRKFIKEAQTIAEMDNNHIIRIYDIFEENGTAYYVMEYLQGGDLKSRIPSGGVGESEALGYIRQIADALSYIHHKKILHLDIKPVNVLFKNNGIAVLIDFGISKHYDEAGGGQTSSTPVGISEGYAPTEQYESEGLSSFSASTDIYSLGATLYCLLQGERPPKASVVLNDGLPELPSRVSQSTKNAIKSAMSPRRKDRPQSVAEFMRLLEGTSGGYGQKADEVVEDETDLDSRLKKTDKDKKRSTPWGTIAGVIVGILLAIGVAFYLQTGRDTGGNDGKEQEEAVRKANLLQRQKDSLERDQFVKDSIRKVNEASAKKKEELKRAEADRLAKEKAAQEAREREVAEAKKVETERKAKEESDRIAKAEADRRAKEEAERKAEQERQRQQAANSKGVHQGHEWVDLGLSVKWATCNVGANSPSDYGNYYAWGETTTKSEYTEVNSKTYGKSIGDISGNPSYDAARANWGGKWRLPTTSEFEELKNRCRWEWTAQSGHNGYRVTGTNGNSIFLPATGWHYGTLFYNAGERGYYWSSSPGEGSTLSAYYLGFDSSGHGVYWGYRNGGQSVRPVLE